MNNDFKSGNGGIIHYFHDCIHREQGHPSGLLVTPWAGLGYGLIWILSKTYFNTCSNNTLGKGQVAH